MTEQVQKRMELMTEELEEMRRTNLFTSEETRTLMKKRKEFEYKIHAHTKDLKSFTDYIAYEKCLLKDISLRRDKYKIGEKKGSIEHKIIKRIKMLYEIALQRYSSDIPLFLCYLKFCKKVNYVNAATDVVANMIKKHPDNPKLWQVAASWHAYDRKDMNTALLMLLKGLAIHKDSQLLYKEMLQIELYSATENIRDETTKKYQQEQCSQRLEQILNTIFSLINISSFYLEILELLEKHRFTSKIQELIITKLTTDHFNDENMWHLLAQRERRGIYCTNESQTENGEDTELNVTKTRTPKARLETCFAKYKQGLSAVSPEVKPKLWALYLDFLLELQQDNFGGATVLKMETLKNALNEASLEGYSSEKHYMAWLEFVSGKEAVEIAEKGTNAIPQSVELWKSRLRLQIISDRNDTSEVDKVFKMGIKALKDTALPLWSAIIRYHYLTSTDDLIQSIYEDGVKQVKEISNVLKPQYLEWLTLTKGIEPAREIYKKLSLQKPHCKEFHTMMSKLESMQIDYDFDNWEQIHKLACEQFGKEDVDVWIDYIQFYLHFRNVPNMHEQVQRICKQAEETLSKPLIFDFIDKYKKITQSA